jgi:predicted permease
MSTMAGQGPGPGQGLLTSFLAAIQASLSVLLVISYGALSARLQVLDAASAKAISKICVRFFLPALLLTKIGSELHAGSASRYLVVLIWALICHLVSFVVGSLAHLVFGMPDWITVAIMFNNTTSYPLLLVQSLDATGILSVLVAGDGTTHDAIERAKSYFLVFATVSSCLTFAVGPRLIDAEHAPDPKENHETDDEDGDDGERREEDSNEATDRTQLLGADTTQLQQLLVSTSFFPSRRRSSTPKAAHYDDRRLSCLVISKRRWDRLHDRARWWLLLLYDFLNAPLLSAVLGAIIGLVPALHRAFFASTDDGGIFTAWLTASLSNIGSVFVPLPVLIAGVSLYLSTQQPKSDEDAKTRTPWLTTGFVLLVRFVLWPVVSIAVIYLLASRTAWLGDDPMLWFAMMLMPTGPPAMKLIAMVEVSDADEEDEHKLAKLLTVSPFPFPPLHSWLQVVDRNVDIVYHFAGSGIYGCREFES